MENGNYNFGGKPSTKSGQERGKIQDSENTGIFQLNFVEKLPLDEQDPEDRFKDSIKLSSVNEEMQSPFDKVDHGKGNLIAKFESRIFLHLHSRHRIHLIN